MLIETLAIGLLMSCLFVELTGIYPGGLIVPAYFAAHLDQPMRVVGTVTISLVLWIIYRVLAQWLILFGHRRFVLFLSLSTLLGVFSHRLLPMIWPTSLELRVIGWVVPGILANSFERQGIWRSVCSLVIVTVVVYFSVHLIWG